MSAPVHIEFFHGLGDCANFILVARAYRHAGVDLRVICDENKQPFFAACGIPTVFRADSGTVRGKLSHPWWEPGGLQSITQKNVTSQNKIWNNLTAAPLPKLSQNSSELWRELATHQIPDAFDAHMAPVAALLADLPRPIVLIHSCGNTSSKQKNMPVNFPAEIAKIFLQHNTGSVVFLDWDNRVSWAHSSRARHIGSHYSGQLTTPEMLMGLIAYADLLVGIDSGPFHLAGVVDKPSIGVWFDHHPLRYAVPRKNCLNIVTIAHNGNFWSSTDFNIVQYDKITVEHIFAGISAMLSPPVFSMPPAQYAQIKLMLDKCFGGIAKNTNYVSNVVVDRHISFAKIFDYLNQLNKPFKIVETGCIRADNDWSGAGYSTFLFGLFAQRLGGSLLSIDIDANNIAYASKICANLSAVRLQKSDSLEALANLKDEVDLFYLDSMDANIPGHAEHGLKEAQRAVQKVTPRGLIVFDDTINEGGEFFGKGALAVPWMLQNGWKILFMGHQIILGRT